VSHCRCCGRPKATDEDRKRYQDGEGAHLCWEPDDLRCEDGDPLDPYAEIDALRKRVAELEALVKSETRSAWEHAGMTLMLCEHLGVSPEAVRATAVSRARARWGSPPDEHGPAPLGRPDPQPGQS